jgi:hypothetical protein
VTVTKVKVLNRGDCCGKRLGGTKIFVGDELCGTIKDPKDGEWQTIKCKADGDFLKIKGAPGKYLHFCGLKVWGKGGTAWSEHESDSSS